MFKARAILLLHVVFDPVNGMLVTQFPNSIIEIEMSNVERALSVKIARGPRT